MSFYKNTHSGVRVISTEELLTETLPLGEIFKVVSDSGNEMIFSPKENDGKHKEYFKGTRFDNKCIDCCFYGTCNFSPYYSIRLKCSPEYRSDKKDIFFERADWLD